jgi:hypothetical protein
LVVGTDGSRISGSHIERAVVDDLVRLEPVGLFDGNPALDIPPSPPAACHHQ